MIRTEFGIIPQIDPEADYSHYEPEKYDCVAIDDDIYINDWWDELRLMETYFESLSRPEKGLSRWGVTIIPPKSLPQLEKIVTGDKRITSDENLAALADKIKAAVSENKYMIHYGV